MLAEAYSKAFLLLVLQDSASPKVRNDAVPQQWLRVIFSIPDGYFEARSSDARIRQGAWYVEFARYQYFYLALNGCQDGV